MNLFDTLFDYNSNFGDFDIRRSNGCQQYLMWETSNSIISLTVATFERFHKICKGSIIFDRVNTDTIVTLFT